MGASGRVDSKLPGAAYIGGQQVEAVSGQTFANFSPTTGDILNEVAAADVADVDRAVAAARSAFVQGDWANSSPGDRKRVLLQLVDLIRANAEELALLECLDMGKPISDATQRRRPRGCRCLAVACRGN